MQQTSGPTAEPAPASNQTCPTGPVALTRCSGKSVTTADELQRAAKNEGTIKLETNILLDKSIIVEEDLKICGAGWSITAHVPQTETPSFSLFQVEEGVTLDLVSLTVGRTNGAVPFEDGSQWPGCINTTKDSTLLTTDTHFINCTAASKDGGAILAEQAKRVEIVGMVLLLLQEG